MLDDDIQFISIDNRFKDDNGNIKCLLPNNSIIQFPPDIKHVPTLQIFSANNKYELIEGEPNIKEYFSLQLNKNIIKATKSNMEPMSYNSFMSNQFSLINQDLSNNLSIQYDSLSNQYDIYDVNKNKVSDNIGSDEMMKRTEKMNEERRRDIDILFGKKPENIDFSYK